MPTPYLPLVLDQPSCPVNHRSSSSFGQLEFNSSHYERSSTSPAIRRRTGGGIGIDQEARGTADSPNQALPSASDNIGRGVVFQVPPAMHQFQGHPSIGLRNNVRCHPHGGPAAAPYRGVR
mmetsp:Transcript_2309/g.4777  ORF Transcript_2309/g.4777 Transcript_2309/m.4777 type:complete len:121 (-) Transcript_2309:913-1275(-)